MSTEPSRPAGRFALRWRLAEVGAALALGLLVWTTVFDPGWRPLWIWVESSAVGVPVAVWRLMRFDPQGTGRDVLILLARSALIFAPALVLALRVKRHRLAWLLPLLPGVPAIGVLSMVCGSTWWTWPLLATTSAGACLLVLRRIRWAWLLVALPPVIAVAPALAHRGAPFLHSRESLAARCASNDGVRPRNLGDAHLCPGYYGLTPAAPDRLLLTFRDFGADCPAEAASRWVRWDGQDLWLEDRVRIDGSHLRGCLLDGRLWFVSDGVLSDLPADPGPQVARNVVVYPQHADWDSTDTACDPARGTVYLGEAAQGGLWTRTPDGAFFRRQFDAEGLFPMVRRDGRVVMASGHALWTFDPAADRLLDRVESGIATLGADLCAADDSVVVADLAGRLRFYAPAGDGYRFDWGIAAGVPRYVAFSPDCRYVATSSVNDATVRVIDRTARTEIARFQVGPAPRGLAFLDARHVAAVDACTATLLAF